MKIGTLALVSIIGTADAMNLRSIFAKHSPEPAEPAAEPSASLNAAAEPTERGLSHSSSSSYGTEWWTPPADEPHWIVTDNCWHKDTEDPPAPQWNPDYSGGWANGHCTYRRDCNQQGLSTEIACCKQYFAGQMSGACLNSLPSPPTTSPTTSGGLDVYYPDYTIAWTEGYCINDRDMPSGRPTYSTMLACCKGAYGGQVSGKCISMLPSPPTTSPTQSGGITDFWYPDYDTAWSIAGCKNEFPLPYPNVNDRPNYKTQLACCKGAYGGQVSGACIAELPSPPTQSPTGDGDIWYPSFMIDGVGWQEGLCSSKRPIPNNVGPTYSTQLSCCKGAYPGQMTGNCLADLPNPPTTSPTTLTGNDWYASFNVVEGVGWGQGVCDNARPVPNNVGPTYTSEKACCAGQYFSQESHSCICKADSCTGCECEGDGSWKDGATQITVNEGSGSSFKTYKVWTGTNCQNLLQSGKTYYTCDKEDITTPSPTKRPTSKPTPPPTN